MRAGSSLWRLRALGIAGQVQLRTLDLLDYEAIAQAIREVQPAEIYNFAAQSTLGEAARDPALAGELNGLAVARFLHAIRSIDPSIRFAQASSSQMYGRADAAPQNEETPFHPDSPYAIAKHYAHLIAGHYRTAHGLHASTGILFNHESPLRGPEFVTRKIAGGLAAIARASGPPLELGNTLARRDWSHARDVVRAMYLMTQQETPDDYVIASGEARTVQEFVGAAAECLGLTLTWEGAARARDRSGKLIVETKPELMREEHGALMVGDASKARRVLGWQPETSFAELVSEMVEAEVNRLSAGVPREARG